MINAEIADNNSRKGTFFPVLLEIRTVTLLVVKVISPNIAEAQPEQNQNPTLPELEIHRTNLSENPVLEVDLEDFLVLTIDSDNQVNTVKDKINGGVRTLSNLEGLGLKKTFMVSLGNLNPYFTEIQIDSASAVSFMKKNLLLELKIRDL